MHRTARKTKGKRREAKGKGLHAPPRGSVQPTTLCAPRPELTTWSPDYKQDVSHSLRQAMGEFYGGSWWAWCECASTPFHLPESIEYLTPPPPPHKSSAPWTPRIQTKLGLQSAGKLSQSTQKLPNASLERRKIIPKTTSRQLERRCKTRNTEKEREKEKITHKNINNELNYRPRHASFFERHETQLRARKTLETKRTTKVTTRKSPTSTRSPSPGSQRR